MAREGANPEIVRGYSKRGMMRRTTLTTRALEYLLCCSFLCSSAMLGGSVNGRVVDGATGAGIGGVQVRLSPLPVGAAPDVVAAPTDDSGAFHIANIPDGSFVPLLHKDGYFQTLAPVIPNALNVTGVTQVEYKMTRLARLSGREIDQERKPVAGVTVLAESSWPGTPTAVTDSEGGFAIEGLAPGFYTLSAQLKIPSEAADGERMVTTFYPASIERQRAQQIQVSGLNLPDYDIQMQSAVVRKIRGVVIDVDGEPLAQATVGLSRPGPSGTGAEDVEQVLTDDEGKFEFTPAMEGEYGVWADYSLDYDYEEHRPLTRSASRRVRISSGEMEPVELRLAPGFSIPITLDWGDEDDPAAKHPNLRPQVVPMERQPVPFPGSDSQKIDGLFPGRYLFRSPGFSSELGRYYVAAMTLDGRDVLDQEVELSGPGSLKIVFRTDGGTVRGHVANGQGASVVLLNASGRVLGTECDANGDFALGGLAPGEYSVGAFPRGMTRDTTAAVRASGVRVKVESGATATIDLKVN